MSIYFPATRASYDPWYSTFVSTFAAAMSDWDKFLNAIYDLGSAIAADASQSERRAARGGEPCQEWELLVLMRWG